MNEHIVFIFPLLSPFCVKATLSSPYHPQDDCCKRQQNTGLQHLLNLDKCATCCALKLQCNGQMQGVGFYTKTYSTKRICWQRWHSASKRGCKKKRGKLLRGIFDPLALTKHHKYPRELATQQHAWGLYLLKLSDTHTPPKNGDTVARKAPISQPCPSLSVKEKSTYIHAPPNQWFSLGRAQTSKKETMRW